MLTTIRHKATKALSAIGAALVFTVAASFVGAVPAQAQEYWHGGPGYWHERDDWRAREWREHEWRIHHPYYVYNRYWDRPAYAYPPAYYQPAVPFGFNVYVR